MINLDKTSPQNESETSEKTTTQVKNLSKKSLFNLNSDLRSALDTWEVLTEEVSAKVSPQEEQLDEVKKLLKDLKKKLSEFGD